MDLLGTCPGRHVAALQPEHAVIAWGNPQLDRSRIRVRRHTCECRRTLYELCTAGGLMFIRRTIRDLGGNGRTISVRETERWNARRIEDLWSDLLRGAAI